MFWHLRMILAYKKTLGRFTKVLGFEKTPLPPLWEKLPKNPVFWGGSVPKHLADEIVHGKPMHWQESIIGVSLDDNSSRC